MNDGTGLQYLINDHLSSTSLVLNASGNKVSEQRYTPWGGVRDIPGTTDPIGQTDFGYTGQRNYASIGLMDYNARFYSPRLGRFTQPDTIIPDPGNSQSLNRYTYAYNSPIKYNDPSGHTPITPFLLLIGGLLMITSGADMFELNVMAAANISQNPEIKSERAAKQLWQDNCMGQCHYAGTAPITPGVSKTQPNTPFNDKLNSYYWGASKSAVKVASGLVLSQ